MHHASSATRCVFSRPILSRSDFPPLSPSHHHITTTTPTPQRLDAGILTWAWPTRPPRPDREEEHALAFLPGQGTRRVANPLSLSRTQGIESCLVFFVKRSPNLSPSILATFSLSRQRDKGPLVLSRRGLVDLEHKTTDLFPDDAWSPLLLLPRQNDRQRREWMNGFTTLPPRKTEKKRMIKRYLYITSSTVLTPLQRSKHVDSTSAILNLFGGGTVKPFIHVSLIRNRDFSSTSRKHCVRISEREYATQHLPLAVNKPIDLSRSGRTKLE